MSSDTATKTLSGKTFFGWWIVAACVLSFGISVGIPYYNMPFFYDYFQKTNGWRLDQVTLGFPLAALLTIWAGPVLVPYFSPRKLILAGSGLTAISLIGFSMMRGSVEVYYALYFVYTVGYIFSGPIPHQILVSYWFRKRRGIAMGIVYVGVGLFGALGARLVKPLTEAFNFHTTLLIMGLAMFAIWPLTLFVMRDKPAEKGFFPDGAAAPPADLTLNPQSYSALLKSWPFWLLLIGSVASIGSIGSINFHMKFVFRDSGFADQKSLNAVWSSVQSWILISSIAGRLSIGYCSDLFSKKWIMTATYFVMAMTIPVLLMVNPSSNPMVFAIVFGFAMGADYMLIPLMAAEQFGVNTLSRAMAILLPANTIGQTWCPQLVSILREHSGDYKTPMAFVFGLSMLGAIAIALLPRQGSSTSTPVPIEAAAREAV